MSKAVFKRIISSILALCMLCGAVLSFAEETPEEMIVEQEIVVTQEPAPTPEPVVTQAPTEPPSLPPTEVPTEAPTEAPTEQPTEVPSEAPTELPTELPTEAPTEPPLEEVELEQAEQEPTFIPGYALIKAGAKLVDEDDEEEELADAAVMFAYAHEEALGRVYLACNLGGKLQKYWTQEKYVLMLDDEDVEKYERAIKEAKGEDKPEALEYTNMLLLPIELKEDEKKPAAKNEQKQEQMSSTPNAQETAQEEVKAEAVQEEEPSALMIMQNLQSQFINAPSVELDMPSEQLTITMENAVGQVHLYAQDDQELFLGEFDGQAQFSLSELGITAEQETQLWTAVELEGVLSERASVVIPARPAYDGGTALLTDIRITSAFISGQSGYAYALSSMDALCPEFFDGEGGISGLTANTEYAVWGKRLATQEALASEWTRLEGVNCKTMPRKLVALSYAPTEHKSELSENWTPVFAPFGADIYFVNPEDMSSMDEAMADAYTIAWSTTDGIELSAAPSNAGEYQIKVTLIEDVAAEYELSETSLRYSILPLDIASEELHFVDDESCIYKGEAQLPSSPSVMWNETVLDAQYYTIETIDGKNATNAGGAWAQLSGMGGNVVGTREVEYTIAQKMIDVPEQSLSVVYSASACEIVFAELPEQVESTELTNWREHGTQEVLESAPINVGNYDVTVSYVSGDANYQTLTRDEQLTISPAQVTVIPESFSPRYYNGDTAVEITGTNWSIQGKLGDDELALDLSEVHASVESPGAGDGKPIVFSGVELVGKDAANYTIKSIEERTIDIILPDGVTLNWPDASSITYGDSLSKSLLAGGSTEYGSFAWADGEKVPSKAGTQSYDVRFTPNSDAGNPFVGAELQKSIPVKVNPRPASIYASNVKKTYGDADAGFTASTKDVLKGDKLDYKLRRSAGEDAGSYTITVVLGENPNYELTTHNGTLTIEAKDIAAKSIAIASILRQIYTASLIEPKLTISDGTKKLEQGKDYTLEYSDNYNPGEASVTITGKGNYSGQRKESFTIYKLSTGGTGGIVTNNNDVEGELSPGMLASDDWADEPFEPIDNLLYDELLGTYGDEGLKALELVRNEDDEAEAYELLLYENQDMQASMLVLAEAGLDGNIMQRSLHLSGAQLERLSTERGIQKLEFRNCEVALTLPIEELISGDTAKLVRALIDGEIEAGSDPLARDFSLVDEVTLEKEDIKRLSFKLVLSPVELEDQPRGYAGEVWLELEDEAIEISVLLPTLEIAINVDGMFEAGDEEGFLEVATNAAVSGDEEMSLNSALRYSPEVDCETGEYFSLTPAMEDEEPLIQHGEDIELADYRRAMLVSPWSNEGVLALFDERYAV